MARISFMCGLLSGTAILAATPAYCQSVQAAAPSEKSTSPEEASGGIADIIVTAQKRAQSINSVGLTITAASGEALQQRGIVDTADLAKIVPGFTFTLSSANTPIYTLRGVGLYDLSFGAAPSVAVYVDEVSLPFPIMTQGATLDLERAEVLKGPQGTLFGQSSTGGAINYIAAKPTNSFAAGMDASYDNFGKADLSGFVSGPVTDTLRARLAVRAVQGGDWQYSASRPNDKAGAADQLLGRLLVDWTPSDRFKVEINLNGWRDKSDVQQPQFLGNQLNIVAAPDARNPFATVDPVAFNALTNPASPNFDPSFANRQNIVFNRAGAGEPETLVFLAGPNGDGSAVGSSIRKAEWTPGFPTGTDDSFYQGSIRFNYELTDSITATSITSYAKVKVDRFYDGDATAAAALDDELFGFVKNFSQELRLSGNTSRLNWIIGANYDRTSSSDTTRFNLRQASLNEVIPGNRFDLLDVGVRQKIKNYAVFANAEYKIAGGLSVLAGIRYTKSRRKAAHCNVDLSAGQGLALALGAAPGTCYSLNDVVAPTDPGFFAPTVTPFVQRLNEDNVSWRVGANYKFDQGALIYATASRGYKAGIFSQIGAVIASQFVPATQEKLTAYEAGFKLPLFDRRVQFNGSGFYYDYSDKQVRARVLDPVFGLLELLVNVPKSRIWGLEAELQAQPIAGLNLSLSGTYLNSKVTESFSASRIVYNQAGYSGDFTGSPLPYTPKYSAAGDVQYEAPLTDSVNAFLGSTLTYQGRDNSTFYVGNLRADDFFRREHVLLDLRAGIADPDGAWRLTVFGRNMTNKLYETSYFASDTIYRNVGRPRTYGLTLSLRTK